MTGTSKSRVEGRMRMNIDGIEVEVCRKSIKNMYLRVKAPDGRVVLSAPRHMPDQAIRDFVSSHAAWIAKQRAAIERRLPYEQPGDALPEYIALWGRSYKLNVEEGARFALEFAEGEGGSGEHTSPPTATFTVPPASSVARQQAWLREEYRRILRAAVEEALPRLEALTGLQCAEWHLKRMKTRWGSCNPRARRIWLNVRLAEHSPECLDYVIVHELAHLAESSHGPRFKRLMDEFMPNWRELRKQLNAPVTFQPG